MAQDFARHFYKSSAWERTAKSYMRTFVDLSGHQVSKSRDGWVRDDGTVVPDSSVVPPGMCERCFSIGELKPAKLVHHIKSLSPETIDNAAISLSYDNLQRLCQDCHAHVHSDRPPSRVRFNADGTIDESARVSFRERVLDATTIGESERRNIYKSK